MPAAGSYADVLGVTAQVSAVRLLLSTCMAARCGSGLHQGWGSKPLPEIDEGMWVLYNLHQAMLLLGYLAQQRARCCCTTAWTKQRLAIQTCGRIDWRLRLTWHGTPPICTAV